jgi:hypothetical protein
MTSASPEVVPELDSMSDSGLLFHLALYLAFESLSLVAARICSKLAKTFNSSGHVTNTLGSLWSFYSAMLVPALLTAGFSAIGSLCLNATWCLKNSIMLLNEGV